MSKKLLSILCALAMLVSMVTIAVVTVSADAPVLDKSIKSLEQATVTPIYGTSTKYNLASTGTFTDTTYGDGFVSESWADIGQGVTIDYGNYNMGAFEFGGVIGFRNQTADGYTHNVTLTVGDVSVTFSGVAGQSYAVSATYKGQPLALKNSADADFTATAWANTGAQYSDYSATHATIMAARGVTSGWFSTTGKWPNSTLPVKIGYADGKLTLYTGSNAKDTWKSAATATLAGADFSNANVSLTTTAGKGVWYVYNIEGKYMEPSNAGSSSEASSDTSSVDTSSQTPSVDTSSQTPSVDTSSQTPSVDTSSQTPSVDTSSQTPSVDTSSQTPSVDTSSQTSSADTSSQTTSSEKPREVVTTDMGGLGTATCVIPEDLDWNAQGSGLVKTSLTGDALMIGAASRDVNLTANVGTYAINSYFKLNFDLFAKNGTLEKNGIKEGSENWIVTVGDFVFTFTRPTLDAAKGNEDIMLQSVTYKGTALAIEGVTNYGFDLYVKHDHKSEATLAAAAELKTLLENRRDNGDIKTVAWMFTNGLPNAANFYPTFHHNVEIVYDNGKITITVGAGNTAGNAPVVATVDATSVVDTSKELGACGVSVNLHSTKDRGTHITALGNFKGAYEKGTATTGGGSGTNGGNGANGGNGGKNPSTGDTRNIALPICLAVAFVAVAGSAVLLCKKRA